MGSTITTLTAALRNDLKDVDATAYFWTDAELERHIARAVAEYQHALPLVSSVSKNGDGATRRFDVSAATGYLYTLAVEHPVDEDPPAYLAFREEYLGSIYVLSDDPPGSGVNNVKIWYAKAHTVSAGMGTLPADDEQLVLEGAAGYSAIAGARYAAGRLNASQWTPRQLREWGDERLRQFRERLLALTLARANDWARRPCWARETD